MARIHIAAALVTATAFLIITLQLLSSYGLPSIDFLRLTQDSNLFADVNQIPISPPGLGHEAEDGGIAHAASGTKYLLGVGRADITGPVVELNMMGYADPAQVGTGLRQRLYSRAFIIGDLERPEDRFVYMVLDTQSGDTAVRYGILEKLDSLGPEYQMYRQSNIAVTGTHSHSGPGAWLNYLLPQITSKGFDKQSYQAIVDGAVKSVQRAHESLQPGYLTVNSKTVHDASVNRSPFAYLANPLKERAMYEHDVDKELTMLKFQSATSGLSIGVLTWFPVHGTSMLGNNTLVSGDNKGVAAKLFEEKAARTAEPGFVAGFSQANVGDTSPNILGAYCEDDTGGPCNFEDSTCSGKNEPCHGRGPLFREKDEGASSCYEIGRRQFEAAFTLYKDMEESVTDAIPINGGEVRSLHTFKDLSDYTFPHPNGSEVSTCPAALGYSFAAGTTDGPGAFDFKQNGSGEPNANPIWAVVSGFLHEPDEAQIACHAPKPILLDVGDIKRPYLWTPNIVDVQLLRVGQMIIIVSPGEATTMAGRRWKDAISQSAVTNLGVEEPIVVLGGPANSYTHYIATEEEYAIQRYEGASTLYGPHTLNAHINLTVSHLPYLHTHSTLSPPPGPMPPDYRDDALSFITGVALDRPPFFKSFGDVLVDSDPSYPAGSTVSVTFVGANPRNDLRLEDTYAAVETLVEPDIWVKIRDDADWSLIFRWKRVNSILATSEVNITWGIDVDEALFPKGSQFRIRYFGASKAPFTGSIEQFEGTSSVFSVV